MRCNFCMFYFICFCFISFYFWGCNTTRCIDLDFSLFFNYLSMVASHYKNCLYLIASILFATNVPWIKMCEVVFFFF